VLLFSNEVFFEAVMDTILGDQYECFTCSIRFKERVFNIIREWERVHFDTKLPEIEIEDAYGLECYCSQTCLEGRRDEVMEREGVPIRRPGTGPVESCAKCGGPVDMSEFHLTYIEDEAIDTGMYVSSVINVEYLAVVCNRCRPREMSDSACESIKELNAEQL
jgi:predicted nucleic-acid-binding Zn-ribbon protein